MSYKDLPVIGGGGSATWGGITGTLSNQTDLQTALNLLAPLASPTFSGSLKLNNPAFSDTGVLEQITGNSNGYQQELLQNTNNGSSASTDFIVANDLGTASTYYGDFGINSSTFSGTGSLAIPNATYLYSANGDLAIGTYTANALHFFTNNGATDAMSISSAGAVSIGSGSGILKTTSGVISQATAGTDYQLPITNPVTGTGVNGQVSFWSGSSTQSSSSNLFWDSVNNRLGLMGAVPTHTMTHSSTSTGIAFYNTTDQTVNYERIRKSWATNIFSITSEAAGSGTVRPIQLVGGTRILSINPTVNAGLGAVDITNTQSSLAGSIFSAQGSYNGSATIQNGISVFNTVQQTSTAAFNALYISPLLTSVGSGGTYLINAGTNTGASNGGTHSPKFTVDSSGNITSGNLATLGHTFHNQIDQVTNFEKVQMSYTSNVFNITSSAGGTGTARAITLLSSGVGFVADSSASAVLSGSKTNVTFGTTSTVAGAGLFSVTGTVQAASGTQNPFGVCPTVNQSSTAAVNVTFISPYFQATGSGGSFLLNAGINSAANGTGTHIPLFQVDNNGNVFAASGYTAVSTNTAINLKPRSTYTTSGTGVALCSGVTFSPTSGQVYGVSITPIYNEVTSSSANTDLLVNRTQTSIGSGAQKLIDLQVGGTSQFSVSNTALISMPTTNTATTVGATGAASTLPVAPVGYLQVVIGGTTYKLPYYNN